MNLNLKNTKLLGAATIVLILAISYFLVLSPVITSRQDVSQEVETASAELESLRNTTMQYQQAKTRYADNTERDRLLSGAVPTAENASNITSQILDAGNRVGLSPDSISINVEPAKVDGEGNALFASAPVSIGAEGDSSQLAAFTKEIGNLERAIFIDTITINRNEETSVLTITGKTFVYAPINVPADPNAQPSPVDPNAAPIPDGAAPAPNG